LKAGFLEKAIKKEELGEKGEKLTISNGPSDKADNGGMGPAFLVL
jgi:hypothetical protein